MKHYGLEVPENTNGIKNLTTPVGTSFPAMENAGELFFRTDEEKLYVHGDTEWLDVTGNTFSWPLTAPDGTVGAPSYSWENDTDTGFYRSAPNTISVSIEGSDLFHFRRTGSPGTFGIDLHIKNDVAGDAQLRIETDTVTKDSIIQLITDSGTWKVVNDDTDSNLEFSFGDTIVLNLESDGTLSVPGTSPNYADKVTNENDIPNKKYVDDAITTGGGAYLPLVGGNMSGAINMDGNNIGNISIVSGTYGVATGSPDIYAQDLGILYDTNITLGSHVLAFGVLDTDWGGHNIDHLWYSDVSVADCQGVFHFVADGSYRDQNSDAGVVAKQYFGDTAGTSINPVFTFENDTNTGMYSLGADQIGFATGGTNALTIDASQNLTINGLISGVSTPVSGSDAANKVYVDSLSAGLDPKESVRMASTENIAGTFASGSPAGVGTTITLTGSPTLSFSIDNVDVVNDDRVLLKDQTDAKENGIYTVSGVGSGIILTRALDQDGSPDNEVSAGNYTFVEQGSSNIGRGYTVLGDGILQVDVDDINWSLISGPIAGFPLLGPDGLFSDPTYSFSSDTDTGMYRSNTNNLSFATGGTQRLLIAENGKLTVYATDYETLVTADDDIPNKKYVDDSITSGGLQDIVEDTTPQLGGNLDVNGFNIVTPNETGTTNAGDIDIVAGDGGPSGGQGGEVHIYGGASGTAEFGGDIRIGAGEGGTSLAGGNVHIEGGEGGSTGGNGGYAKLEGGPGGSTTGDGGAVNLIGGDGRRGGAVSITGGTPSNASMDGANVTLTATDGGATYSTGGNVILNAGEGATMPGRVLLYGGDGAASGGAITLLGGNATAGTTVGGPIQLKGGQGFSTGAGGDILLQPGISAGSPKTLGAVVVDSQPGSTEASVVQFIEGSAGANYIGLKAPDSLTTNRTWTLPIDDPSTASGKFLTTNSSGLLSFDAPVGTGSELTGTTTNATPTELSIAGSPLTYYTIGTDETHLVEVLIVARRTDASGGHSMWKVLQGIKNVSGTTSLVGTPVTTVVSNASGWSISLTADDTNDRLAITVTGEASKTINWKATITSSVVS